MSRTKDGVKLLDPFREKLKKQLLDAIQSSHINKKTAQEIAGKLMWLNYTVGRTPLSLRPHTLDLLRTLPDMEGDLEVSENLKVELNLWLTDLDLGYTTTPTHPESSDLWSDATPHRLAFVVDDIVLLAKTDSARQIAIMEALAAGWGIIFLGYRANLFIDNQQVAYALAKGHCRSNEINTILRNIFRTRNI